MGPAEAAVREKLFFLNAPVSEFNAGLLRQMMDEIDQERAANDVIVKALEANQAQPTDPEKT